MNVRYIIFIILCLLISWFINIKVAEAKWFSFTKEVQANVEEVKIIKKVYQVGEKVPEEEIDRLIALYATSTKATQMKRTLYCESHYYNVQSNVINRVGNREDSWGIAQINLYWNPSVTKEQALDPEFSIKWMADHWETTRWYALDRVTNSCNPISI